MKPTCLVCHKQLSRYPAKHCRVHSLLGNTRSKGKNLGHTHGFKKGYVPWNKGLPAPWAKGEQNVNWGKFGSAHPKWTGKTLLTKSIRACPQYRAWRFAIFQRDSFTCQDCGQKSGYLEADHYPVRFAEILRTHRVRTYQRALSCKALWIAQGRTLCIKCHHRPGRLPKVDYRGKTIKL